MTATNGTNNQVSFQSQMTATNGTNNQVSFQSETQSSATFSPSDPFLHIIHVPNVPIIHIHGVQEEMQSVDHYQINWVPICMGKKPDLDSLDNSGATTTHDSWYQFRLRTCRGTALATGTWSKWHTLPNWSQLSMPFVATTNPKNLIICTSTIFYKPI